MGYKRGKASNDNRGTGNRWAIRKAQSCLKKGKRWKKRKIKSAQM